MENDQALKIYSDLTNQIYTEINKVRTNPKSYVSIIQDIVKNNFITEDNDKILTRSDKAKILLDEGKSAYLDAIKFLEKQEPVAELKVDSNLSQAAVDHVTDIGINSLYSHSGSNDSTLINRVEKYCEWDSGLAENIFFNEESAQNIVVGFIVDDGDSSRSQRENLFNSEFKFVGVSSGDHFSLMKNSTVVIFALNVRSIGSEPLYTDSNKKEEDGSQSSRAKFLPPKTGYENSNNHMQEVDPDAPDDAVSVKYHSKTSTVNGNTFRTTQKIYTLKNGSTHIVEIMKQEEKKE